MLRLWKCKEALHVLSRSPDPYTWSGKTELKSHWLPLAIYAEKLKACGNLKVQHFHTCRSIHFHWLMQNHRFDSKKTNTAAAFQSRCSLSVHHPSALAYIWRAGPGSVKFWRIQSGGNDWMGRLTIWLYVLDENSTKISKASKKKLFGIQKSSGMKDFDFCAFCTVLPSISTARQHLRRGPFLSCHQRPRKSICELFKSLSKLYG